MFEEITKLGMSANATITLLVLLPAVAYVAKSIFDVLIKKHERNSEIKNQERKQIIGLSNTINKLVVDYDHYVKHLAEGDSIYEGKVGKCYEEIRAISRKLYAMVKQDFPNMLETIYDFTDFGRAVSPSGNGYLDFNRRHVAVGKLMDGIHEKYL